MRNRKTKMLPFPPALKLLLRGYLIMGFILLMAHYRIIPHVPFLIFLITVVSISMVFGVGYLLVTAGKPVRTSSFDVPNTTLFFVKGIMVLYFISLLGEFGILPRVMTALFMLGVAGILVLAGVASYVYEVLDRARPVRAVKCGPRTR